MPIAATLSAKVYPDTKLFGPALQKYLTRIELRTRVKVPVKPTFDEKDLPEKVPTSQPMKLPVELDPLTAAFQKEVKRQTEALSKLVQVNVPVSAETEELRTDLSSKLAALQKSVSVKIPTEPADRREYERKLQTLLTEVEAHVHATIPAKVSEPEIVKETVKAVKVAEKAAPKIRVKTEIDSSGLDHLGSALGKLGKGSAGFAQLTVLPALAAQAAVGMGQFVAALAPAAGILVALPGLVLAGAAALGVFKLATSGVGEAIGAGLTGDMKKFNKAMEGLTPAAQTAVRAVVSLKPEFDKLRASVQTAFFTGITEDIKQLGTVYLPLLQRQLPPIAAAFSGFTQNIVTGLTDAATSTALSTLLTAVADGLARANDGIAPLIVGLAQLGAVAAPFIGDIAGGFAEATRTFGLFLSKAAESGQLTAFLNTARATLEQLGTILGNVGSIFSSVFQAAGASGGNLLGTLSTVTASVATFFKSAEGGAALQAVFSALAQVGQALSGALAAVLPALGQALVNLAPSIGPLASALGSVLAAAAPLLPVIGQLAGIVAQLLTTALGNLSAILGPLIGAFAQTLAPILARVSGAFATMAPLVAQVAQQFGGQLLAAFLKLAPTLIKVADTLITAMLPHLPKIAEVMGLIATAVGEAAAQIGDQLNQVLVELIPYLPTIVDLGLRLGLMVLQILPPIIRLSTTLSQAIPIVLGIAQAARDFGAMLGTNLRKAIDDTVAGVKSIGEFFSNIGTKIADFVTKTIPSWFAAVGTFFSELPGKVGAVLSALPGQLATLAADALRQMAYAIGFGIGLVVRYFIELPGKIADAFTFVKQIVLDGAAAVVTFFTELPGKVGAEVTRLWNIATALFLTGVDKAVAYVVGLKDQVVSTFTNLWARGKQLVSDGIDAVVAFFRALPQRTGDAVSSLPGKIAGILSELIDKAKTIGGQVVDGLVQGLKNAAGNALQAVKDLGSNLAKGFKDALGIHSPSRVFAALGTQIPAGIAQGMDRAADLVDAASSRLADRTLTGFPLDPDAGSGGTGGGGGGMFTGTLVLEDGTFMGRIRGQMASVVDDAFGQLADAHVYGTG